MDYFDKAKDPNWSPRRMLPTWKVILILILLLVALLLAGCGRIGFDGRMAPKPLPQTISN